MNFSPAFASYHMWSCADCHPDYNEDRPEDERYEDPMEVIFPIGELGLTGRSDEPCPLDNCPRCGSHMGFCSEGEVKIERKIDTPLKLRAKDQDAARKALVHVTKEGLKTGRWPTSIEVSIAGEEVPVESL